MAYLPLSDTVLEKLMIFWELWFWLHIMVTQEHGDGFEVLSRERRGYYWTDTALRGQYKPGIDFLNKTVLAACVFHYNLLFFLTK